MPWSERKCCVKNCKSSNDSSYHCIPANKHLNSKWKEILNVHTDHQINDYTLVCGAHFTSDCFMITYKRTMLTIRATKKYTNSAKWNLLFDTSPEWIAFKPQPGMKAYACYSCKNIFSSRLTFQDHINRRVITIKYKCTFCSNTLTFYNRCSFLLHARKHFTTTGGQINLANVDIFLLPPELAGFAHNELVPFLYNEGEEYVTDNSYINTQFYTPEENDTKQIITMKPNSLTFSCQNDGKDVILILKQITSNMPLCQFVVQENDKESPPSPVEEDSNEISNLSVEDLLIPEIEIKQEKDLDEFPLPIISKIESLSEIAIVKRRPICSECSKPQDGSMAAHFSGRNKPLDENLCCLICKYIAPTKCSLSAHKRTHHHLSPFICPECGKNFKNFDNLSNHMEEVCFHTCKQLRFRCPAMKCGKIFVVHNTFVGHFANHIQTVFQCDECNIVSYNETDFGEHAKLHESCSALKRYHCTVCKNMFQFNENTYQEHIRAHVNNRERCIYIYTCRTCRSYFRSTATYIVHRNRCSKEKITNQNSTCCFCNQRIVFRETDNYKTCTTCKQINYNPINMARINDKKSMCILCKEEVLEEYKTEHALNCKYNNPVVTVSDFSEDNDKWNDTFSDNDSKSNNSDKTIEDNRNKKRKRSNITPSTTTTKNKRNSTASINSETIEEPTFFDGIYRCKICKYENGNRDDFHKHIITHRDISTAYQCMECGECFVVKPSLLKHLLHYHKIEDAHGYLMKNNCFDKEAIEKLENHLKLGGSGESQGPLNENQCSVCMKQFDNAAEFKTHFRIHGMAFLMKNT